MKTIYRVLLLTIVLSGLVNISQSQWLSTNGPFGGDVRAIEATADGNIWAGTRNGGVFLSSNDGELWTAMGLIGSDVYAVRANQANDIFAAVMGGGVFRSTDAGQTWTAVNTGLTYPWVISLVINAGGDIFAGTFEGGGIFRSTDNGDNWVPVNNGLTNT